MFFRLIDPEHPLYDAELAAQYGNAIRDSYVRCDTIVAKAMEFADNHTTLMIVSDHGFHSFRRGVNLNTWFVLNGYNAYVAMNDRIKIMENELKKRNWNLFVSVYVDERCFIDTAFHKRHRLFGPSECPEHTDFLNELLRPVVRFCDRQRRISRVPVDR